MTPSAPPALRVEDLTVRFRRRGLDVPAVNGVSFSLARGETLTILGESGSGKSVSLKALMGLLPDYARTEGNVWLDGRSVLDMPAAELAKLRGGAISMIFQEPMAALDPVYTIGEQIAETIVQHEGVGRATAMRRARDLLDHVMIPSAARRLKSYPHEMSGGMRQRAMIALALACKPKILLADEPTTALDATVQIQILLLLRELQREFGMSVIFVTHDIGVAIEICDRVAVMYAGQIVEQGTLSQIVRSPIHPTRGAARLHRAWRAARPRARDDPGHAARSCATAARLRLAPRCRYVSDPCTHGEVPVTISPTGAMVRCIRAVPAQAQEMSA
jgi:peptide/nickel transport system ATP-binding protein